MFVASTGIHLKHIKLLDIQIVLIVWLFAMQIYPIHSFYWHTECDLKVNISK